MRKFICLLLILTFVVQPASTLADVHPVFNIKVHQSPVEAMLKAKGPELLEDRRPG